MPEVLRRVQLGTLGWQAYQRDVPGPEPSTWHEILILRIATGVGSGHID